MSQLRERSVRQAGPVPDGAVLSEPRERGGRGGTARRMLGAIAVLVVGAVHLEQYFAVHFDVVPIIGPLFLLNFAGGMVIGLGLLVPAARMRPLRPLLALGGIGLAGAAFVFLFVSEHRPLFGFQDYGHRAAILVALAAEAAAVAFLGSYLVDCLRRG